jgi:hypothetical protein
MRITYANFLETFQTLVLEGIPKESARDAIELDSEQTYENEDLIQALNVAYAETSLVKNVDYCDRFGDES